MYKKLFYKYLILFNQIFVKEVLKVTQEELNIILENHKKWLRVIGGERANLSGANLCGVDLGYADLRYATLSNTYLSCANLSNTYLTYVSMRNANLSGADLRNANLSGADLRNANLSGANLRNANLSGANLRCAYMCDTNLSGADVSSIRYNEQTAYYAIQCPEEGAYIGYKKAQDLIVKLQITEDSKRSSASTRKCRASKAKVLSITSLDGKQFFNEAESDYDSSFVYKVGETIEVKNFDENRWNECATGIHHFITRQEAVLY